jgi:hypothetical protein
MAQQRRKRIPPLIYAMEKKEKRKKGKTAAAWRPLTQQIQTTRTELGTKTTLQAERTGTSLEQTTAAIDLAKRTDKTRLARLQHAGSFSLETMTDAHAGCQRASTTHRPLQLGQYPTTRLWRFDEATRPSRGRLRNTGWTTGGTQWRNT